MKTNKGKAFSITIWVIFILALIVFLFGGYWEKIFSGIILGIVVTFGISSIGDSL